MNVLRFPVHEIRHDNALQAQRNHIEAQIRAKEQEIAKLAHAIWLHKLELEGLRHG